MTNIIEFKPKQTVAQPEGVAGFMPVYLYSNSRDGRAYCEKQYAGISIEAMSLIYEGNRSLTWAWNDTITEEELSMLSDESFERNGEYPLYFAIYAVNNEIQIF